MPNLKIQNITKKETSIYLTVAMSQSPNFLYISSVTWKWLTSMIPTSAFVRLHTEIQDDLYCQPSFPIPVVETRECLYSKPSTCLEKPGFFSPFWAQQWWTHSVFSPCFDPSSVWNCSLMVLVVRHILDYYAFVLLINLWSILEGNRKTVILFNHNNIDIFVVIDDQSLR